MRLLKTKLWYIRFLIPKEVRLKNLNKLKFLIKLILLTFVFLNPNRKCELVNKK